MAILWIKEVIVDGLIRSVVHLGEIKFLYIAMSNFIILWVWGICARILCNHNMENNDDNKLSKKIKKKLNIELYIQAALYAK